MSLITEALKRAQKTTDRQPPAQTPPPVITPRIEKRPVKVSQAHTQRHASWWLTAALVAVLLVACGLAARVWLFNRPSQERLTISNEAKSDREHTPGPAKPATDIAVKEPAPPALKPAEATPLKNTEVAQNTHTPEKLEKEQTAIQPPPISQPLPELPKLTLQGIMAEGNDREAVINGVSIRIGEVVEGAKVMAIDTRSVRLDFHGTEILLRLP